MDKSLGFSGLNFELKAFLKSSLTLITFYFLNGFYNNNKFKLK